MAPASILGARFGREGAGGGLEDAQLFVRQVDIYIYLAYIYNI